MKIKAIETKLEGCFILEPTLFTDERGYFYESFNQDKFTNLIGKQVNFVQDNQSFSSYGVIRGLHAQEGVAAQAKLVRVLQGKVLDVAVDIRPHSPTFGQHIAVELSAQNHRQLFIPRGFLHGFSVLSSTAVFFYKCDNFYNKQAEIGYRYNSPQLAINWKVSESKQIISEKDLLLPSFEK